MFPDQGAAVSVPLSDVDIAHRLVWAAARHGGLDSIKDVAYAYLKAEKNNSAAVRYVLRQRLVKLLEEDGYKVVRIK